MKLKVSLIQMNSQADKNANLLQAENLIEAAIAKDKPDFILLPEMFHHRGGTLRQKYDAAEKLSPEHIKTAAAYQQMSRLAAKHKIFLQAGSISEQTDKAMFNTSVIFNPQGQEITRYRKIHLFDVETPNGDQYLESSFYSPGTEIKLFDLRGIKVGCSICFDLRFGELYRLLRAQGAQMITVPSAFTAITGEAHWEILMRARAIETQCFFLGAQQTGSYQDNDQSRATWGRSIIVDPWGNILAQMGETVGFISAELDFTHLTRIRTQMPLQSRLKGL